MNAHDVRRSRVIDHQHIPVQRRLSEGQAVAPSSLLHQTVTGGSLTASVRILPVRVDAYLGIGVERSVNGLSQAGANRARSKPIHPGKHRTAVRQDGGVRGLVGEA